MARFRMRRDGTAKCWYLHIEHCTLHFARRIFGLVYNNEFGFNLWSDKKMIRFLQTPGPTKKIVLGGLLIVICVAMVITLIPGGLGSDILGQPGRGVIAKVDGNDITAEQVRQTARQM